MSRKSLILASVWPSRASTAAATRLLDLIASLQKAGDTLIVSADEKAGEAAAELEAQGIRCLRLAPNDPAFDLFLQEFKPDLVLFDRYTSEEKFAWRVREQCPEAFRVLDTIDLHFLRLGREKALRTAALEKLSWQDIVRFAGDTLHRELAAIHRSDLSLVVSDFEERLLTEKCGIPPAQLLLCRLTYPQPLANPPAFTERKGYAMIGNFRHAPNHDAVLWLRDAIWPHIRRLQPDAEVRVYGAFALPKHKALSQVKEGFHVEGFTPDAVDALKRSRVNLAPLRFGAGIKGKIADGWFSGTPVLSTSLGAEGMHGDLPFAGLLAEDPEALAAAAVMLYHDEELWNAKAQEGQLLISQLYSEKATTKVFLSCLEVVIPERHVRRLAHLTGHILWQQAFRSTEYFSRWIEIKNAKSERSELSGPV